MVIFFLTDLDDELDRNEILEYNALLGEFGAERSQALGVVKATARRVRDVSEELKLSIPILADAGGEMIEDFGVAEPDGRARRVTFLVDRNGTIIRRIDSSPTEDQAATMLNAVKALKSGEIEAAEGGESAEPPG